MPNINIKATHLTLNQSETDYVTKKMQTFFKFLYDDNDIHVELGADKHHSGDKFRAEITISPKPGIYAEATGEDIYAAIDLCVPKIKEQLAKQKDKRVAQRRRLGSERKEETEEGLI